MLSVKDVLAARDRIRGSVALTPCPLSEPFSELCGAQIHFKLENLQRTGSFKERGAANKFALLTADERKRGVVAASAGNHAQAVAYNAQRMGIHATIVMPEVAPLSKIVATKKFGADVVLQGTSYDDAQAKARELEEKHGYVFIHAFDDDAIIAGQGTAALEILEQVPDIDVLIASIGGGGFLGGMALVMKEMKPSVRVVGVESSRFPKMRAALDAGGPVLVPAATTLADGIAVKRAGEKTLPLFRKCVDEIVGVDDEEVANAILALIEREKTVAEGAGAAPAAALLHQKVKGLSPRTKVVCAISGGNIDVNVIARIIERGLVVEGRRVMLSVRVPDRPGMLAGVLASVAAEHANVLEVVHNRAFLSGPVGDTEIALTLETRGPEHIEALTRALTAKGYAVVRR
jgi:threonine dehydratase